MTAMAVIRTNRGNCFQTGAVPHYCWAAKGEPVERCYLAVVNWAVRRGGRCCRTGVWWVLAVRFAPKAVVMCHCVRPQYCANRV